MNPRNTALAALLLALALAGCDNVQTPQGEVTYLYKRAKWYRAASLEGTQRGPTSTGFVWQMSALSFDYRPKTYNEPFEILVKDDINMTFEATAIISIRTDEESVREIVEGWGLKWYDNIVKETFRSTTRDVVGNYESRDIRESRQAISAAIKDGLIAKLDAYETRLKELNPEVYRKVPVDIQGVNIDNLDYPAELREVISKTRELEKRLEQKDTELEIAEKDRKRMVLEAASIAKRNETIAGTLSDEYITHYAIEAAKKIARSECPTIVVIPTDPRAPGVPYIRANAPRDLPRKPQPATK